MRRLLLIMLVAGLAGCAWFRDPPETDVTTGATVVYSAGKGSEVFSICDKTDKVFLTRKNPQVFVVKDGCAPGGPGGVGGPGGPSPAAVAAVSERINLPAFPTIPQPFLVQLVPPPGPPPPVAAQLPVVPPEPIIVQIQPQAQPTLGCPACPVAPPVLQPQVQVLPRSAGPPTPAAKALTVAQVDPNTASLADLERLPGVTKQIADAITKGRPYRTTHELVEKRALTEAEFKALRPYFVIR